MGEVQAQGAKEIREAVVIAALSTVATGLINWALERAKQAVAKREQAKAQTGGEA